MAVKFYNRKERCSSKQAEKKKNKDDEQEEDKWIHKKLRVTEQKIVENGKNERDVEKY